MGITKRLMERDQELYDLGLQLCIAVGAIEECQFHPGTYYDGGGEVEEAYKLANSRVSGGEIELWDSEDRRTITDAVKGAYEDNYGVDRCMQCQKVYDSD